MKKVPELCRDRRQVKRLHEISEHKYSGSSISLAARMNHEVIGRHGWSKDQQRMSIVWNALFLVQVPMFNTALITS